MIELYVHQYTLPDGRALTELRGDDLSPDIFGLMWVDALRHAAVMFKVPEERIWEMVDKERACPTTTLSEVKPN